MQHNIRSSILRITFNHAFGYPSLHDIFAEAKSNFRLSIGNRRNTVMSSLLAISPIEEEDEV